MQRITPGSVVATLLLGACGGEVPVTEAEGEARVAPMYGGPEAGDGGTDPVVGGGGSLPIGYYERQCQWDACEPPPQKQPRPLVDPIADRVRSGRPPARPY